MTVGSAKPSLKSLRPVKRRGVQLKSENLVEIEPLAPEHEIPWRIQPAVEKLELLGWVRENTALLRKQLTEHGALLLRGFEVGGIETFEECVKSLSGSLLQYTYRSTPRDEVSGRIYTSTSYPADRTIPQHNEMSYSRSWPMKLWFYSIKSAEEGGETPLADSRRTYERIPAEIRDAFARKGVSYVRNYGEGVDLPWQNVFQTDDRSEVEAFCERAGIEFEWRGGDRLRTRQVAQAVARHPETGEMLWFNQAHLFHISALPEEARALLLERFAEEDLPRNSYFGDGSRIPDAMIDQIQAAYRQELVTFPWQDEDVLLLDNMLVTHGRRPYGGSRKVVVGMAEDMSDPGL